MIILNFFGNSTTVILQLLTASTTATLFMSILNWAGGQIPKIIKISQPNKNSSSHRLYNPVVWTFKVQVTFICFRLNPNRHDVWEACQTWGGGLLEPPYLSQPFMVRFSKFFCLVKACENHDWFLFHNWLPIVPIFSSKKSTIFNF